MEMLFGPFGVKPWELAQHYPSTALIIATAGLAAIDWLINPRGPPATPELADSLMQAIGTAANKRPHAEIADGACINRRCRRSQLKFPDNLFSCKLGVRFGRGVIRGHDAGYRLA
jgi:hypothetical protein